MNALRRAIGRKEVILGLLFSLLAGGWFGWRFVLRPAAAQVAAAESLARIREPLDAGRFSQAIAEADTLLATQPNLPAIAKYKAIAQLLGGDVPAALTTAAAALAAGAAGEDAAALLAVRSFVLGSQGYQQGPAAKAAAEQALHEVGSDPEAALLARVACAAALRSEWDGPVPPPNIAQQAGQIRQVLRPVYPDGAVEPQPVWLSKLWRRGLALSVDAGILAGDGGDSAGELSCVQLLQRVCPQDVWGCYLQIPDKAMRSIRTSVTAGSGIDEHARIALYTATGYLYTQAGDRRHCDILFRRAIRSYVNLLNTADDWSGQRETTVTPNGQFRTVGEEFYTYRNRLEMLAKYSADWWGMRAVRGQVTLQAALDACDYMIFRALVRLRADKQADPVRIAVEEHLRPDFMETLAIWLEKFPYEPQAAWEKERAAGLRQVATEQVYVNGVLRETHAMSDPASAGRDMPAARELLIGALGGRPALPANRVRLRVCLADLHMVDRQYAAALPLLEESLQDLDQAEPYLAAQSLYDTSDILRRKCQALLLDRQMPKAVELAESIAGDTRYRDDLRLHMLKELAVMYAHVDPAAASRAQARLRDYTLREPQYEDLRQSLLHFVSTVLRRASTRTEGLQP